MANKRIDVFKLFRKKNVSTAISDHRWSIIQTYAVKTSVVGNSSFRFWKFNVLRYTFCICALCERMKSYNIWHGEVIRKETNSTNRSSSLETFSNYTGIKYYDGSHFISLFFNCCQFNDWQSLMQIFCNNGTNPHIYLVHFARTSLVNSREDGACSIERERERDRAQPIITMHTTNACVRAQLNSILCRSSSPAVANQSIQLQILPYNFVFALNR